MQNANQAKLWLTAASNDVNIIEKDGVTVKEVKSYDIFGKELATRHFPFEATQLKDSEGFMDVSIGYWIGSEFIRKDENGNESTHNNVDAYDVILKNQADLPRITALLDKAGYYAREKQPVAGMITFGKKNTKVHAEVGRIVAKNKLIASYKSDTSIEHPDY